MTAGLVAAALASSAVGGISCVLVSMEVENFMAISYAISLPELAACWSRTSPSTLDAEIFTVKGLGDWVREKLPS